MSTMTTGMMGQEMIDLTKRHTIFDWSAQAKVDPIPVAGAKGCYFWTPEGKRFLDFNSQLMCSNIDHGNERVIKAIQEQAAKLAYASPVMATEPRARLGAKLAITTGNTFVLKANYRVPQTSMRMAELLAEVGIPAGVFNLVTCSDEEAERLIKHPKVRGVTFVGSTQIGRHVYATATAHGKRVQCLTSAKNHALVLRDVPIKAAAQRINNSAFGCAGERCMALPAVVVEEAIADELVAAVVDLARSRRMGPAWEKTTELGPLVTAEHRASVISWIEKGVQEGADLVLDGRDAKVPGYEHGNFLGPTVFDRATPGMRIGIDEIFGPVLCIKRVKDFEEGLALINASEFANGASIFTLNGHYAREFARRADAGMVGINVGIPVPFSAFPFSGHKSSFFGDLHVMGRDGVLFFTEIKVVTSYWYNQDDMRGERVGTWEGLMKR